MIYHTVSHNGSQKTPMRTAASYLLCRPVARQEAPPPQNGRRCVLEEEPGRQVLAVPGGLLQPRVWGLAEASASPGPHRYRAGLNIACMSAHVQTTRKGYYAFVWPLAAT